MLGLIKETKKRGSFTVINDRGLHTRPSTELVRCATRYSADIYLVYKKQKVNAKSLLGILMLAAPKGAKIGVQASGDDAEEAVATILELAKHQFYMRY